MRLYFVRHGESEANVLRVISNRGQVHPLTEKGIRQAEALANRLAEAPDAQNIRQIYSSPLLRAAQTAEILARVLHVPVEETDALREFDCGIIEGRSDEAAWAEHKRVREDWCLRGLTSSRIEGGESLNDIQARFRPFVQALIEGPEQDILLVGHGGLYKVALPGVLVNIEQAFANDHLMGNTDFVITERRAEGLVAVEWCGIALV